MLMVMYFLTFVHDEDPCFFACSGYPYKGSFKGSIGVSFEGFLKGSFIGAPLDVETQHLLDRTCVFWFRVYRV